MPFCRLPDFARRRLTPPIPRAESALASIWRTPRKDTSMRKTLMTIAGLTAAAFALPAQAQWYAGAGFGQSTFKDELSCQGSGAGVSCDDKDTALKLFGGMQINPNFAAEATYQNFGKVSISGGGFSAEIKSYA